MVEGESVELGDALSEALGVTDRPNVGDTDALGDVEPVADELGAGELAGDGVAGRLTAPDAEALAGANTELDADGVAGGDGAGEDHDERPDDVDADALAEAEPAV